jgi:hypothetical protein
MHGRCLVCQSPRKNRCAQAAPDQIYPEAHEIHSVRKGRHFIGDDLRPHRDFPAVIWQQTLYAIA